MKTQKKPPAVYRVAWSCEDCGRQVTVPNTKEWEHITPAVLCACEAATKRRRALTPGVP